jgi:DivIVA domain-containing protein
MGSWGFLRRLGAGAAESANAPSSSGLIFQLARRNGYNRVDVDTFIEQLEAIPDTPEGRQTAYELITNVRFHLARRNGYEPSEVDDYVDHKLAELQS